MFLQIKKRIRGLAISTILLAVVLIAAIAVAIALSVRSGNAGSATQQAKLNATTILNMAQNLKTGFDKMQANGIDISTITFDNAANTGLWNPVVGGTVAQNTYPPTATINQSAFMWMYHGSSALVKLMNVGTGAGNYLIELDPLTLATCQQINQLLFGNTTVPKITNIDHLGSANPVDLSMDTATNGRTETCVESPSGTYQYYKTIVEQ